MYLLVAFASGVLSSLYIRYLVNRTPPDAGWILYRMSLFGVIIGGLGLLGTFKPNMLLIYIFGGALIGAVCTAVIIAIRSVRSSVS